MEKKVLTEISLYYGKVSTPKGFEINRSELAHHILHSKIHNQTFLFSKEWDALNIYCREHLQLKYKLKLVNKKTWGSIYSPHQNTLPLLDINPVDLKNSPDYTKLYGVEVNNCSVVIHYDNNRRKGCSWTLPLKTNEFVLFPSTQLYYLTNDQKEDLNFVQTITYEYI